MKIAPVLTAAGFGTFTFLYHVSRRNTSCSARAANAIVSGLHAVVMIIAGALSIMRDDYWKSIGRPTPTSVVRQSALFSHSECIQ